MAEDGGVISLRAQRAITKILPELADLRELLRKLLPWPSLYRRKALPPIRKSFPQQKYESVTGGIVRAIKRDAGILLRSNAIPWLQSPRGQSSLKCISFDRRFATRCGRGQDRDPNLLRVGRTFGPRQTRLLKEIRDFRRRLEAAPKTTISQLKQGAGRTLSVKENQTTHSQDFASVTWFGTQYTFTPTQRKVVEVLWKAWEAKSPGVSAGELLKCAQSSGHCLRDLFKVCGKKHPAWNTMIVMAEGRKGVYRLTPPTVECVDPSNRK